MAVRTAAGRQRGTVTAETAVVLPVLVLVLAAAVSGVVVVGAQLRCVDAAREAVRAAARGEDRRTVLSLAGSAAPDGAEVSVAAGADHVRVVVSADVAPLVVLPLQVGVRAAAVARLEPGVAGGSP